MFDEEIEKAILYYMIFEKYRFAVNEDDFIELKHKKIIKAINALNAENTEVSMLNIASKIDANKTQVLTYLSNLSEYVFGTTAETAYKKLIENSKKRQLYNLIKVIENEIKSTENIDNLIEIEIDKLNRIQQRGTQSKNFSEQVIDAMREIENSYQKRDDYSLYTGMLDLDKIILGLHEQELTIIGARPGVGKTTFALQIAEKLLSNNKNVAFISLEMAATQLIQKMIAKISNVNTYRMRLGTLEDDDFEKIAKVCAEIKDLPFYMTNKARTIQEIEMIARKLKNENRLDVLIIDYIQLVRNNKKFQNREQEVADISRTLKLLSLELEIPIIGLCQLNRNANRNEPTLADLRESGSIEQDADNVIFLYMDQEQEDLLQPQIIIKVAKQRAGGIGKVVMLFKKVTSEFCTMVKK